MSWATVEAKLVFLAGFPPGQENDIRNMLRDAYINTAAGSEVRRLLDSVTATQILTFEYLAGDARASDSANRIQLDVSFLATLGYLTPEGTLVAADVTLSILHEIAHLDGSGQLDPPYDATNVSRPTTDAERNTPNWDYDGPVVRSQNLMADELGEPRQSSYESGGILGWGWLSGLALNQNYTGGQPISVVRFGGVGVNVADHRLRLADMNDLIFALAGNDEIYAGLGNDHLYGGEGDDELYGGAGDDRLIGGRGNDRIDGGQPGLAQADDGRDRVDYSIDADAMPMTHGLTMAIADAGPGSNQPTGVTISDDGYGDQDTLISIETITATAFADTLTFAGVFDDDLDLTLDGVQGAVDVADMSGYANGFWLELDDTGAGFLAARATTGEIDGGRVLLENLSAEVTGSNHADAFSMSAEGGVLNGGDGNDWLHALSLTDELNGNDGNDRLVADSADGIVLDGGGGNDVVDTLGAFRENGSAGPPGTGVTVRFGTGGGHDVILSRQVGEEANAAGEGAVTRLYESAVTLITIEGVISASEVELKLGDVRTEVSASYPWGSSTSGDEFKLYERDLVIQLATGDTIVVGRVTVAEDASAGILYGDDYSSYNGHEGGFGIDGLPGLQVHIGSEVFWIDELINPSSITTPITLTDPSGVPVDGPRVGYIAGTTDGDTMAGGGGGDLMKGGAGDDTLMGGGGKDRVFGEDGDDNLKGEAGDDFLEGGLGVDLLEGGEGDDLLYGGGGDDTLQSGAGNDEIDGGEGLDTAQYLETRDSYVIGVGPWGLTVAGIDGTDMLSVERLAFSDVIVTVTQAAGNVDGTSSSDVILGDWANDTLYGFAGDDILGGLAQDDQLYGGDGRDALFGGHGDDALDGGSGDDRIDGGEGLDTAFFDGARSLYKIYSFQDQIVVVGPGGKDYLASVEVLRFADADYEPGLIVCFVPGQPDGAPKGAAGLTLPLVFDPLPENVEGLFDPPMSDAVDPQVLPSEPDGKAAVGGDDALVLPFADEPGPLVVLPGLEGKAQPDDGPVICLPVDVEVGVDVMRPVDLSRFDIDLPDLALLPGERGRPATVAQDYDWIV